LKTRGRSRGLALRSASPRRREGGFTLVEVVIALAIIALTAAVLLDRRVEIVRDAGRSRDVKTAWVLAAQKLAELELDKTLWLGEGSQSSGDFGEVDSAYAAWTWEYVAERIPVETVDPVDLKPGQKPKEIFRVGLKVEGPGLGEPVMLEAMFPVQEPPAPSPPGTPANPASPGTTPPGPLPGVPPK
jgi:prepilin-type N-terminal cleavage/methylation domain-containing protein